MKTINESIEELMSKRGWYNTLGFSRQRADYYKKQFKEGKLGYEKKAELLILCGYKIAQVEMWDKL